MAARTHLTRTLANALRAPLPPAGSKTSQARQAFICWRRFLPYSKQEQGLHLLWPAALWSYHGNAAALRRMVRQWLKARTQAILITGADPPVLVVLGCLTCRLKVFLLRPPRDPITDIEGFTALSACGRPIFLDRGSTPPPPEYGAANRRRETARQPDLDLDALQQYAAAAFAGQRIHLRFQGGLCRTWRRHGDAGEAG